MLTAKFKTDLTGLIPRLVGFSLGTNVTVFFFFFSAAHLLFRLHLDSFYLVSQVKTSHEIRSIINKTHQTVDLYILLLYEYSNILIKTFLNIKLKRPTPLHNHPRSPGEVLSFWHFTSKLF